MLLLLLLLLLLKLSELICALIILQGLALLAMEVVFVHAYRLLYGYTLGLVQRFLLSRSESRCGRSLDILVLSRSLLLLLIVLLSATATNLDALSATATADAAQARD